MTHDWPVHSQWTPKGGGGGEKQDKNKKNTQTCWLFFMDGKKFPVLLDYWGGGACVLVEKKWTPACAGGGGFHRHPRPAWSVSWGIDLELCKWHTLTQELRIRSGIFTNMVWCSWCMASGWRQNHTESSNRTSAWRNNFTYKWSIAEIHLTPQCHCLRYSHINVVTKSLRSIGNMAYNECGRLTL